MHIPAHAVLASPPPLTITRANESSIYYNNIFYISVLPLLAMMGFANQSIHKYTKIVILKST